MDKNETPVEREWLSVDRAFLACQEADLDRTKKTIRTWCRNGHVEALKQTTPTGERWMVESSSLSVKIRSELEFQQSKPEVQTRTHQSEPVQAWDEPVRTRTDAFAQVRTGSNQAEYSGQNNGDSAALTAQLQSLTIDKAVRDKQIEFLTKQNDEGQRSLLGQCRYIGHLETQVLHLGGAPDQQFIDAPVPKPSDEVIPDIVNSQQVPLQHVQ